MDISLLFLFLALNWQTQTSGVILWHLKATLDNPHILLYCTIFSKLDYSYLQSDANTVQDWVNCNHVS